VWNWTAKTQREKKHRGKKNQKKWTFETINKGENIPPAIRRKSNSKKNRGESSSTNLVKKDRERRAETGKNKKHLPTLGWFQKGKHWEHRKPPRESAFPQARGNGKKTHQGEAQKRQSKNRRRDWGIFPAGGKGKRLGSTQIRRGKRDFPMGRERGRRPGGGGLQNGVLGTEERKIKSMGSPGMKEMGKKRHHRHALRNKVGRRQNHQRNLGRSKKLRLEGKKPKGTQFSDITVQIKAQASIGPG